MHHRFGILVREAQAVAEEEGAHERQLLELLQSDGVTEQLPLGLQREELVDELLGVGQEVVVVVLVPGEKRQLCQRAGLGVRFTSFSLAWQNI